MKRPDIHQLFHPQSIAIVGASSDLDRGATFFLDALLEMGYGGKLFPINPKVDRALGIKTYPSLLDVQDRIDHAIIGIPAKYAPSVVKEAVEKGVKNIHLFTSGFAEAHSKEGVSLQKEIIALARGKTRIIGPNCMGIYHPKMKIAFQPGQSPVPGSAGFISQSGGMAGLFAEIAAQEQNYCSKVISIGNSSDLKLSDFLEYLGEDEETKTISMYIEGLGHQEGEKFKTALRKATLKKPVLIWKGGQTPDGAKAASSHTGAMASEYKIWKSIARQTGAIMVDGVHEMHDFIKLYRMAAMPKSKKTCLVTLGGGNSVTYTDLCSNIGIELPELAESVQEELLEFIPSVGTIRKNPVDLSGNAFNPKVLGNALKTIGKDSNIDSIIFTFEIKSFSGRSSKMGIDPKRLLRGWAKAVDYAKSRIDKLVLCCYPMLLENIDAETYRLHLKNELHEKQIPGFPTVERTLKALHRYIDYALFLNRNK
jgi:acetate---CoA ligase (ADP-forming)